MKQSRPDEGTARAPSPSPRRWRGLGGLARDVAQDVLIRGPKSRRELATEFDVSAATLTRTVAPLLDAGVLVELDTPPPSGIGRPARLLDVPVGTERFVGVKLTETLLHGVLTDVRAGILQSRTVPLPDHAPEAAADAVAALITELDELDHSSEAVAVGISLGGMNRDGRVVQRAPFLHWQDVPLAELVEERCGVPATLENDLIAITEAERWFGEGREVASFAILTVGIGIGYGLAVNGRVVRHRDAGVGLVGHFPLDPSGPTCTAGHRGCAEAMLSTTAISTQVSIAHGRVVGYDEALALAAGGDPAAHAVVRRSGLALGRLVAAVANIAFPERIFLSGEGIALTDVAWEFVLAGMETDRDPAASPIDLVVHPYDSDQWARGAATVAIQQYVLGSASAPGR